jgi:aryl-alcohol dehydrogenase-like predicted oxidoreductase
VAEAKGATVAQVAIGWVLSRGEDVVPPVVGAAIQEGIDLAVVLNALRARRSVARAPRSSARA